MRLQEPPRTRFLAYARLNGFQRKIEQAKKHIETWLSYSKRPYIAYSSGKDSTVLLSLVREQRADVPAVYFDAACAFPEVTALLDQTGSLLRIMADEPFLETLARYGLHGGAELNRATMESTVWGPVRRLLSEHGFDGMAYGIRADESYGRKMSANGNGPVFFHKRDGVIACQPLIRWTYDDVWAYIFSHELPYCATYDRMWDMPEREQRISYWAGETSRERGRYVWLKRNYPDLWNRLCAAIPDVRAYA